MPGEPVAPDAVLLATPRAMAPPFPLPRRAPLETEGISWRVGFVAGALYWGFSRDNLLIQAVGIASAARLAWELATRGDPVAHR